MDYTINEIAKLANVTVKTLHHYHKIGLLVPYKRSASGYRFYSQNELERLQEILFFRELDFPLKNIREILRQDAERVNILSKQRDMLLERKRRLEGLCKTIDDSILHAARKETMSTEALFKGFNETEWRDALAEQAQYIKENYGYDMLGEKSIDVDLLNEQAQEGTRFLNALAQALRDGLSYQDKKVQDILSAHLAFLNTHGFSFDPASLLDQVRFLVKDDFHRKMLETKQVGLAYFYLATAEAHANA
jgi:DNA-binding transcriptional MerR regulator